MTEENRQYRKEYFQKVILERIRNRLGENNPDQELKEEILSVVCKKITSVYIGCFEKIEQSFGREVWAHQCSNEMFAQFTPEEQEACKHHAKIWGDCRLNIKVFGNRMIDDVIDILGTITFNKKTDDNHE